MSDDERRLITPEQAEEFAWIHTHDSGRKTIHTFMVGGIALLGADHDLEGAREDFRKAKWIEIGGDVCMGMKHPIVVVDAEHTPTFYEADMDKVNEYLASLVKQ